MASSKYDISVFINCPYDKEYRNIFHALVFTVQDCGFIARAALEIADSSQVRISKITKMIAECRLAVHDLSRTELDTQTQLPRFNMPIELGIFLGAKWLGTAKQKRKLALILDREDDRYHDLSSDISGQDIEAHGNDPEKASRAVRHWLSTFDKETMIPSAKRIWQRYERFKQDLPLYCEAYQQDLDDLTYSDRMKLLAAWLRENSW